MISQLLFASRTMPYQSSIMVNICDLDLIGRKLEQDGLIVSLTREFYQQQIIEQQHAQELLRKCEIANLVGEKIVTEAIEMKLAKEVSIKRIAGVPFLMIYKFQHK
jgi:hypothetical protein